jgi:aquaglyceroporin related protein, other eukaryote
MLGASTAAAVVFANYQAAIDVFEGGHGIRTVGLNTSTAGIFATYPMPHLSTAGMFFSELLCSAILLFGIFALLDSGAVQAQLVPLGLGFLMLAIGTCFGWETGFAMNMARDLGPRLVTYGLGYGSEVWSAGPWYFWVSSFRTMQPTTNTDMLLARFQSLLQSWAACLADFSMTFFSLMARAP